MVMARVPWRCDRANLKGSDADNVVVLQDADAVRRDPGEFSPQPFHVVAIKAGGRRDQFRGIDEMRRAARMDIDGRAEFGETPRRAGMIEMDVAEEDVPDIARIEIEFAKFVLHIPESRLRSGIEKREAILCFKRGGGDDAASAKMLGVEDVDHD
jgi:hypothetical protein